jgi:hypothetical protein
MGTKIAAMGYREAGRDANPSECLGYGAAHAAAPPDREGNIKKIVLPWTGLQEILVR